MRIENVTDFETVDRTVEAFRCALYVAKNASATGVESVGQRVGRMIGFFDWRSELREALSSCSEGGTHEWRTDGAHQNEFCGKCFGSKERSDD